MRRWLGILPLLCLAGTPALAQDSLQKFDKQLEQIRRDTRLMTNPAEPIGNRAYFDYGAYITLNYLSVDDPSLNNRGLRQVDFTAYAHLNLDGAHDFFVRGREFWRDFNPGDQFEHSGDGWDGRLERAYYKFDLAKFLASNKGQQTDGDLSVKVGRDLAYWANGLTLSTELDGGVIDFDYGPAELEILAGVTPLDTVDFDSSRPHFDDKTKRGFYGAMLSTRVGVHRPFVYVLMQRDYNDDDPLDTTLSGNSVVTNFRYQSNYIGLGSTGALTDRLAYGAEFVYEFGNTLSNSFAIDPATGSASAVPQDKDNITAWAGDVQLDYLFPDVHHSRLSGEFIIASGDSDRLSTSNTFGGNKAGTVDHAFNAFGLLNTGLAFAPNVSNLIVLRGGFSTFPCPSTPGFRKMQVGSDLLFFGKMLADGPIDEPTTDQHFLGFEPDVYVNWQMTSDVSVALRYGAFVPGTAIVNDDKIRQFIYAGVTFAF